MTRIQLVNLGPLDDHPIDKGTCFDLMGQEVVIFRDSQGAVYALDNESFGLAGSVSKGTVSKGRLQLHFNKSINLATGRLSDSNHYVRTYQIWIQEGCILIEYAYQVEYSK